MPAPAADKPAPVPRPQLKLDDVIAFLARYLYCTEHQRTLIALWVLHAHCFSAAEVTPYLSIQSALEQSGKTLSLQLLSLLCPNPALTANFAASTLSSRIHILPAAPHLPPRRMPRHPRLPQPQQESHPARYPHQWLPSRSRPHRSQRRTSHFFSQGLRRYWPSAARSGRTLCPHPSRTAQPLCSTA